MALSMQPPWEYRGSHQLLDQLNRNLVAMGVAGFSYHFSWPFHVQNDPSAEIAIFGYNSDWMALYRNPDVRAHDPFPQIAAETGRPVIFSEETRKGKMSLKQRDYLRQSLRYHRRDGIGFLVHGPYGHEAYCSVAYEKMVEDRELLQFPTIEKLVKNTHVTIVNNVVEAERQRIALSKRELEVLQCIAHSQSNKMIAARLNISPGTVDTYVRRVFEKLDANDRIEAILNALCVGLIHL
ncbi:MAG: LuxR C-terminal-related transcriptional regulator [Sphingopyxis sp.]